MLVRNISSIRKCGTSSSNQQTAISNILRQSKRQLTNTTNNDETIISTNTLSTPNRLSAPLINALSFSASFSYGSRQDRGNFGGFNRDRENRGNNNNYGSGFGNRKGSAFDRQSPRGDANEVLEELFLGEKEEKKDFNYNQYAAATVEVKGRDVPSHCETWQSMQLDKDLMKNIEKAGFKEPIRVQQYSIPIINNQRDVMICAQTGSGKTAGFLFPIISHIKANPKDVSPISQDQNYIQFTPSAIIMTPTRELCQQIHAEAIQFCKGIGINSGAVFGGSPSHLQLTSMQRSPPHVLIATPGRLHDLLSRSVVSLRKVKFLVLDEADRMLDMGFAPQIKQIVNEADMPNKENRTTAMFSATFPIEIRQMAASFLKNDHIFLSVGKVGRTADGVSQHFVKVEHPSHRVENLVNMLKTDHEKHGNGNLTLVFLETKRDVENLLFQLGNSGLRVSSIHGDKSQAQRNVALNGFAKGLTPILLATNVAARGIDFKGVTHVINYELPNDMEDYVHRIGRTGRAGRKGKSTTFISSEDTTSSIKKLIDILNDAKQEIPPFLHEMRGTDFGRFGRRGGGNGGFGRQSGGFGRQNGRGSGGFGQMQFGAPGAVNPFEKNKFGNQSSQSQFGRPPSSSSSFGKSSSSSPSSQSEAFDWSIFDKGSELPRKK